MAQYVVDVDGITGAAARVGVSAASIRSEVVAMLNHLTALEGTWQGSASHAFGGLVAQWRTAQAQLEQALDAISNGLKQAAAEYAAAEASAMRLFAR